MAKIHKVTLFLVDACDDFETTKDVLEYYENMKYSPSIKVVSAEQKEFEWDDDLIINYTDTNVNQYQEFFDSIKDGGDYAEN